MPDWTAERVVAAIRQIQQEGGRLNHAAVRRNSLSRAAVNLFGSWDAALQAAGIDAGAVRRCRKPWTRESMVQEIQRKHRAGEPLNAKDVSPEGMRMAARRLFGSWPAALRAAHVELRRIS